MNYFALETALLGFAMTFFGLVLYFSTIIKNRVPVKPLGLIVNLCVGMAYGVWALVLALSGPFLGVLPVAIPAGISIVLGGFFLWVLSQRKTPLGNIQVKVGDTLLPFEVKTSDGTVFTQDNLKGKRILFKFFRGAWCPYCSAELKQFEKMKETLNTYNVEIVALSGDTVDEAAMHKTRDSLSHTLLSDSDLGVVQKYGVEHQNALGADSNNTFLLFGLPFPKSFKFKSMSIPTSLLVDENGVIQWIDQSEDYRIRASETAVMAAVTRVFGPTA